MLVHTIPRTSLKASLLGKKELKLLTKNFFIMRYYVNKNAQSKGEHEVHTGSCSYLPDADNRIYLGDFSNCKEAVKEARKYYDNVDGCYYCCNDCHTK